MITVLEAGDAVGEHDGRRVRAMRLRHRATLSLDLLRPLAHGLRERLLPKLGARAEVVLTPPVVPTHVALELLLERAYVYRVETRSARAWLVFRERAAAALIAATCNEAPAPHSALSQIERRMLDAIARDAAVLCGSLVGDGVESVTPVEPASVGCCAAYFELRIGAPVEAAIGVILAEEPPRPLGAPLSASALGEVAIELRVSLPGPQMTLGDLGALEIGDVLPMSKEEVACMISGDAVIAHGTCGVSRGRNAFLVGPTGESLPA